MGGRGAGIRVLTSGSQGSILYPMASEIIFEVTEAEEGGFTASALGYGIHTQAETREELRSMVRDAVTCYFDDPSVAPPLIRLHFVRDEVLAR